MHSIFSELSLIIAIAAGMALVMRLIRQPLIIGHIFTGILVGPSVFGFVQSPETVEVLGGFGIALLLFIVGLGLNPKEIKEVGRVSLLTGVGQVVFTSSLGFLVVRLLGYSSVSAFYIAVALTFSSTIIILKLLSDKKEQNKLFGKISIGFLLVQDLIASIALLVAAAMGQGGLSYEQLLLLAIKGLGIFVAVYALTNLVLKRMTTFLTRSQEMLFLFAIAWGLGIAALSFELGFSLEVGALLAGITLSTMPYAQEISSRLRPLRDFFIIVFFVSLGAKLDLVGIGPVIWQAIGLSLFVLFGNPLIVMIIMGLLGYTKKTSFKAGLTVAQISEFSIIFMLLGQRHGQVDAQAVTLVTIIGIITIAVSSYMIIYSDRLYSLFENYLSLFERRKTKNEQVKHHNYDAVLFGYLRGGAEFIKVFRGITSKYIVIDYDPDAIDQLERHDIPYLYGDATDIELLEEAGLDKAKLVVSTITDHDTNVFLVQLLEKTNPGVVVICHADSVSQAAKLYELGASYVVMPHFIGTEKIGSMLKSTGLKKTEFKKYRDKHLAYLQTHFEVTEES